MQIESHFASQHRDSGALYSDFLLIVGCNFSVLVSLSNQKSCFPL